MGFADWCEAKSQASGGHYWEGNSNLDFSGNSGLEIACAAGTDHPESWCSPFKSEGYLGRNFGGFGGPGGVAGAPGGLFCSNHTDGQTSTPKLYSDGTCGLPADNPRSYDPDAHACNTAPALYEHYFPAANRGVHCQGVSSGDEVAVEVRDPNGADPAADVAFICNTRGDGGGDVCYQRKDGETGLGKLRTVGGHTFPPNVVPPPLCAEAYPPCLDSSGAPDNAQNPFDGCFDFALLDNPSALAATLSAGGDPDLLVDGVPLLIVAAIRGKAEAVSVIVAAGASPTVRVEKERTLPHLTANWSGDWAVALRVLAHFADALDAPTAQTFTWNTEDFDLQNLDFQAIELLNFNYAFAQSLSGLPVSRALARRMARLLKAQGESCDFTGQADICGIEQAACPGGTDSWTCRGCAAAPNLNAAGDACLAVCPPGQVPMEQAAAGDLQCGCPDGNPVGQKYGDCNEPHRHTDPIAALLDNPALAVTLSDHLVDGVPLLIVAATRGEAEAVSILVTAGADPNVRGEKKRTVPHLTANWGGDWAVALRVLTHFADALDAPTAQTFVWNTEDEDLQNLDFQAIELLNFNYAFAQSLSGLPVSRALARRMARLLKARGESCDFDGQADICGIGQAACPGGTDSWTCRACAAAPNLNVAGDACVAACPPGQVATEAAAAGDLQCGCPDGNPLGPYGDCNEPRTTDPLVALLDNPALAATLSDHLVDGVPLLIVAATLGNAEAVSILVTAGADPNVRGEKKRTLPHLTANWSGDWAVALRVLAHFADALDAPTAKDFIWNTQDEDLQNVDFQAIELLNFNYPRSLSGLPVSRALARRMARLLKSRGESCDFTGVADICGVAQAACPGGTDSWTCRACAAAPNLNAAGTACVAACPPGQVLTEQTAPDDLQCGCPDGNPVGKYGDCESPRHTDQRACETPDPLLNPIGGVLESAESCALTDAHFHGTAPACRIQANDCLNDFETLRRLECHRKSLRFKGNAQGNGVENFCVCGATGERGPCVVRTTVFITVFIADATGGTVSASRAGDDDVQNGEAVPSQTSQTEIVSPGRPAITRRQLIDHFLPLANRERGSCGHETSPFVYSGGFLLDRFTQPGVSFAGLACSAAGSLGNIICVLFTDNGDPAAGYTLRDGGGGSQTFAAGTHMQCHEKFAPCVTSGALDGRDPFRANCSRTDYDTVKAGSPAVTRTRQVATTVTFTATPGDGYRFSMWTDACADESDSPCVLAAGTMDVTVGAEFGCLDFHASAATGDLAGLGCNAAAGADVNAPDESGKTPLHLAAGEGHLEAVQKLLTLGATLNASDADGDTPLTEALDGGHLEIFNLLAAAGGMHQGQACGPLEVPNPDRVSPPCVSCEADEIISDGVCESCGPGEVVSGGACECDSGHRRINEICVHETESLPEDRTTCAEIFGGEWVDLSAAHGVGKGVCSGVDINDTFCLAGTGSALPCLGLFNHVRSCNLLGRPALDPWHCGKACAGGKASGARCLE